MSLYEAAQMLAEDDDAEQRDKPPDSVKSEPPFPWECWVSIHNDLQDQQ
jgi:hypothetical protein